jgi:hypothetical protein
VRSQSVGAPPLVDANEYKRCFWACACDTFILASVGASVRVT